MLDGDMIEGEIEIGQVASLIHDITTVQKLVQKLIQEQRDSLPEKSFF
jgi:enoyl-[acyl-carrier protein] reductase II